MDYHLKRLRALRSVFRRAKIDAFLISKPENIFYITGFRGDDSYLFVTPHTAYILTDERYEEELRHSKTRCTILVRRKEERLADALKHLMRRTRYRTVGFEPTHISYHHFRSLRQKLRPRKLKPCFRIVDALRVIKDPTEIHTIQSAITIAERALASVVRTYFSSRYREKDLSDILEYTMRKLGADGAAFPAIVATGYRSAFPHAQSGRAKVKRNNILLIDFGAKKGGYCCDLTRTFFLGTMTARFRQAYRLVREAQEIAMQAVRVGATIGSVDKKVRTFFRQHKVDEYFTHALGHGIGLEVHESPSLLYSCHDPIRENMVFTVEPGLYFKWGGIRIEDMVRVTRRGAERLTTFPTLSL